MNDPIIHSASLRGSHYVTHEKARRAIELARPMVETWRRNSNIVGSGFLYVVIMDPALRPGDCTFEEAILHEAAYGDPDTWDAAYDQFARDKARLSWQHGQDSHVVQTTRPYVLQHGDSLLGGGICLDGIVVAASGAFPWFDEAFAGSIAYWLRALSQEACQRDMKESKLHAGDLALGKS